jgi:hypothetical protein
MQADAFLIQNLGADQLDVASPPQKKQKHNHQFPLIYKILDLWKILTLKGHSDAVLLNSMFGTYTQNNL